MSNQLVLIAGGSGSGKTTLARRVSAMGAPDVGLASIDSFYAEGVDSPRNYDEPDAIDFRLLVECVRQLLRGEVAQIPVYDFATHSRVGWQPLKPSAVMIVEGILALTNAELRGLSSLNVFVDVTEQTRLERRMRRDVNERGRTRESVIRQWENEVQSMYERYVEPSREFADITIDGEGEVEAAAHLILDKLR